MWHRLLAQRRAGRVGVAACTVQDSKPVFSPYVGEGVTPQSKILRADSTSERECTSQKTGKNYAYAVCTKPYIFPNLGAPISGQGVDIRMLSPPSDRGWRKLKIRSDANFAYGHSKRVSGSGEKFPHFSQKRQSSLGGWRSAPSARSVTVIYSLDTEDICLHNHMWTKFVGVPVLWGEVFKYLTKIFGKIWSTLGGWFSATPENIEI